MASPSGHLRPLIVVTHSHTVVRLVRAKHPDALTGSYSFAHGGRWNPSGAFPVLYTACSPGVARAIARDLFAAGLLDPEDLMPSEQPELVHIAWSGLVVDVASAAGVVAAGFDTDYPHGAGHDVTQPKGRTWHDAGQEGLVCRSASAARLGRSDWAGDCRLYGEVALFADVCATQPAELRRQRFTEWW